MVHGSMGHLVEQLAGEVEMRAVRAQEDFVPTYYKRYNKFNFKQKKYLISNENV